MDYRLERFLEAQERAYGQVKKELTAGRKTSHWIWYIFPQLTFLGHSSNAVFYGIADGEEARAYLAHPVLGARLKECCTILLSLEASDPVRVMGSTTDAKKLRSSMTLFSAVATEETCFDAVLAKLFGGGRDKVTDAFLQNKKP